ncbi:MAG: ferritin-like protein [Pirellulales bacterium]
MDRARFVWRRTPLNGEITKAVLERFTEASLLEAAGAESLETAELPHSPVPLGPRDEAIFLLHTAAEVEHALLVQYLYAWFSIDQTQPNASQWSRTLSTVAIEEMAHLLTVQNVLRALGGPLNWEREDYPFRSDFYPFPFHLEPLSRDSVAKYVAAEMPETPSEHDYPKMPEIRARLADEDQVVNRVGRLYTRLIQMFDNELTDDMFDASTVGFQPDPDAWFGTDPTRGAANPRDILVIPIVGSPAAMRRKAIDALRAIAEQGEGTGARVADSHFDLFYRLYEALPETNPLYGPPAASPSLAVPCHPSTSLSRFDDPEREAGRITHPTSLAWAHLFNARYRLLLTALAHALLVDRSSQPADEQLLRDMAFAFMHNLPNMSTVLSSLPRQIPNRYVCGRFTMAGPPFELPYSLAFPDRPVDRWRQLRDLLRESLVQSRQLAISAPNDYARRLLESLIPDDEALLREIEARLPAPPRLPRLHFRGRFQTNVSTINNGLDGLDTVRMNIDTQGKTDDQFRAWLLETFVDAQGQTRLNGGWNPLGANDFRLDEVTITGVERLGGEFIDDATLDPTIGSRVSLMGIMVDVDPESVVDTQIFPGRFAVTTTSTSEPSSLSGKLSVLHSRGLSFRRNLGVGGSRGAGTQFQGVIQSGDLATTREFSGALGELVAAGQRQGVLVRFSIYLSAPALTEAQLAEKFAAGERPANPSIGTIIGALEPWLGDSPVSAPLGRRLQPVAPAAGASGAIAPAFAVWDEASGKLLLNLLHAIPEKDSSGAKVDIGALELRLKNSAGETSLGLIPYAQEAYEKTAGLVALPVMPAVASRLGDGLLEVVKTIDGTSLFTEEEWTFESDDRGVYVQEGEQFKIRVRVAFRGRPASSGTVFHASEYVREFGAGILFQLALPADQLLAFPRDITVGEQGWAEIPVTALKPGIARLGFHFSSVPAPLNGTTGFYANIRVFPRDDYSALPDSDLTFAKVYDEVLRFYHLLYPAMTSVFSLADESAVRDNAPAILRLIDSTQVNDFAYMPRTRELSQGKRELLVRWCRKTIAGGGGGGGGSAVTLEQALTQMRALIEFLRDSHNAAGFHEGVELPDGSSLAAKFTNADSLIDYLRTGVGINRETGNSLIVPRSTANSAFHRLITGGVPIMRIRFAQVVPSIGKTGLQIVEEWINALPES